LEVNSSPGLEGIETVTSKDIASLMIQHIERNVANTINTKKPHVKGKK
jgi:ribosomal protein S6--L-glutamate ligase